MSPTVTEVEFRPFHETVLEDIGGATNEEMSFIARQLKRTTIPAHAVEPIIMVWGLRRKQLCWAYREDLGVPASLLKQKRAAEEKTAQQNQRPGVELHELHNAMEIFLATSHNHSMSSSTFSWHVRLWERMENLHRLLSRVLGK